MISLFRKNKNKNYSKIPRGTLKVDMHSHLLPGIDDGSQSLEESIALIKQMAGLGYQKLVTTPHVMSDYYRNTPEIILSKLAEVREAVAAEGLSIQIEAAAEYYLDEFIMDSLRNNDRLLTFGNNYLLFETSFMNACSYLDDAVFMMQSSGYQPVLAHPERYVYLFDKFDELVRLREKGVHLQVNLNSLNGYYSKNSKKIAERLIEEKMISFLGTDCHGERHLERLEEVMDSYFFSKAFEGDIINNTLL